MDVGIFTEPQQGASYDTLLEVARATEAGGFDSFFRSDHYLAMGERDGLPGPTDAWITLAGLARETSRIRLGTLVSPITFRQPGQLAITVAQVDQMSGGRVELGLGAGWYETEHSAYGIDFPDLRERYDRLSEQLEILTGLWETAPGDRFSYAGTHYTLADSPALPKPAQAPHPPIVLGGAGKRRNAELTVRHAQEFNTAFKPIEQVREIFGRIGAACDVAGRDRESLKLSVGQVLVAGRDDAEVARRAAAIGREVEEVSQFSFAGSPAQIVDRIGSYAELGATRVYLQVLDLTDLDHLDLIAGEVLPQLGT